MLRTPQPRDPRSDFDVPSEEGGKPATRPFARSDRNCLRLNSIAALTFDPNTIDPHSLRPYSEGPGPDKKPLDAIDPGIVAKVNWQAVRRAQTTFAQSGDTEDPTDGQWAAKLIKFYEEGGDGFPKKRLLEGEEGAPSVNPPRRSTGKARETVVDLLKATILSAKNKGRRRLRTWASVFQVPKNDEVDRAIINCKIINLAFFPPPPLSLAEVGTLLGLLRFFPDAVLATADIRHFFWQLRLPEVDRHRFSVEHGGGALECVALPMGWSWSPWVAQGVAGLVVVEAVRRIGEHMEAYAAEGVRPDSPPPFWYIRERDSGCVKAIIVIWYDNFLVAAARPQGEQDQDWNKLMRKSLDAAMRSFQLQWKKDKKTGLVWDVRDNEAEYIGIHVFRQEGTFAWKHIQENVDGWKTIQLAERMSLVTVAQILGVLAWDTHIRLGLRHGSAIRVLMSRVGAEYHRINADGTPKRVRDLTAFVMTQEELAHLRCAWDRVTRNAPTFAPEQTLSILRLLASDATPTCAAGVVMDRKDRRSGKTFTTRFIIDEFVKRGCHINIIETMAAINTVRLAMAAEPEERNALYAIAVDNTTAVSWFNGKTALDDEVQRELEELDRELAVRGSKAWAWWEPTLSQPADEPSKYEEVSEQKVTECKARLNASARIGMTQLKLTSYRTTEGPGL